MAHGSELEDDEEKKNTSKIKEKPKKKKNFWYYEREKSKYYTNFIMCSFSPPHLASRIRSAVLLVWNLQ